MQRKVIIELSSENDSSDPSEVSLTAIITPVPIPGEKSAVLELSEKIIPVIVHIMKSQHKEPEKVTIQ